MGIGWRPFLQILCSLIKCGMDICTDSGSIPDISTKFGALVYKLGRHPFTVEKAERYRHALQNILRGREVGISPVS